MLKQTFSLHDLLLCVEFPGRWPGLCSSAHTGRIIRVARKMMDAPFRYVMKKTKRDLPSPLDMAGRRQEDFPVRCFGTILARFMQRVMPCEV